MGSSERNIIVHLSQSVHCLTNNSQLPLYRTAQNVILLVNTKITFALKTAQCDRWP
jgi:hypothetical protein